VTSNAVDAADAHPMADSAAPRRSRYGQVAFSKWWDLKGCPVSVGPVSLPCYTIKQYYYALYGHWDGTMSGRDRER
jgi:hypothetical protein